MTKEKNNCSFCGKNEKEVNFMVFGYGTNICESCIDKVYEMKLEDKRIKDSQFLKRLEISRPKEIKEYLDQYV